MVLHITCLGLLNWRIFTPEVFIKPLPQGSVNLPSLITTTTIVHPACYSTFTELTHFLLRFLHHHQIYSPTCWTYWWFRYRDCHSHGFEYRLALALSMGGSFTWEFNNANYEEIPMESSYWERKETTSKGCWYRYRGSSWLCSLDTTARVNWTPGQKLKFRTLV
jgi:hypothetical protein